MPKACIKGIGKQLQSTLSVECMPYYLSLPLIPASGTDNVLNFADCLTNISIISEFVCFIYPHFSGLLD